MRIFPKRELASDSVKGGAGVAAADWVGTAVGEGGREATGVDGTETAGVDCVPHALTSSSATVPARTTFGRTECHRSNFNFQTISVHSAYEEVTGLLHETGCEQRRAAASHRRLSVHHRSDGGLPSRLWAPVRDTIR